MTTEPTPTSTLSQRMKQFEINKIQKSNSRSSTDGSFAEEDFQPRERVPLLPRYPPPKTTIAAVLLLVGGIVFVSLGLSILYTNLLSSGRKDRGLALIILGSLMLLPGSYASFIIYASWRRWPGYDYSQLPSYDDE
eukprot:gene2915-3100_t